MEIPIRISIVENVQALPAHLSIGVIPVGELQVRRLKLVSRTNTPFRILDVHSSSEAVQMKPLSTPDSHEIEYFVECTARRPGNFRGAITVLVAGQGASSDDFILDVPVVWTAVDDVGP